MPQLFGANELMEDVHQRELCIGCGACVGLCPYFRNYQGKTAQLFPCTLDQGRCFAYCPKAEVDLEEIYQQRFGVSYDASPLGPHLEIVASAAGDAMSQGAFQGGGTVSALMAWALKNGHVKAAVLTDRQGLTPTAHVEKDWRAVAGHAGSKFMAAPTLAGLNEAVQQGEHQLGVVGTPCQMLAVAQMLANPFGKTEHEVSVSLAIGLFCNWSLDTRRLSSLLKKHVDVMAVRRMDIPPPPANTMELATDEGTVTLPLSEIRPLIPHTCFTCLDMTAETADVSVGMYEGRSRWNTLIIRSQTGEQMVRGAQADGFLKVEPHDDAVIAHLSQAAEAKKERSMRILMQRELINTVNGKRASVRMPQAAMDRIIASGKR